MNFLFTFALISISVSTLYSKQPLSPAKKSETADKTDVKHTVRCNMTIKYNQRPKYVDKFSQILTEGIFYGRLRSNNFLFDAGSSGHDHYAIGVGGSIIYKSAIYKGLSFTTGLYSSQNLAHRGKDRANEYKSGKDTFSRYSLATKGEYGVTALAQSYLSFKKSRTELKIGRFLFESTLMKSNDTKMIPNAFEGVAFRTSTIPKTKVQLAYITKQKLRDHDSFHRVLAYDDGEEEYASWRENDDGAMHRGFTVSKLDQEGIDDRVLVFEAKNRSIKNSSLTINYTLAPKLVSSLILEGDYKFKLDNGVKLKPSIRYLHQFDNGGGEIGGANLKTDTTGYDDPNSLSNSLIASRFDIVYNATSFRIGYSKVGEGGDIVAPWRGQPTSGYSRAMSRTNWYADTQTIMLRADFDFDKAGVVDGLRVMSRYALQDFDDSKSGVPSDLNMFTFDIVKRFKEYPNFFMKLRTGFVREEHRVMNTDGSYKKDPSYNEMRFEMNYLF